MCLSCGTDQIRKSVRQVVIHLYQLYVRDLPSKEKLPALILVLPFQLYMIDNRSDLFILIKDVDLQLLIRFLFRCIVRKTTCMSSNYGNMSQIQWSRHLNTQVIKH